MDQTVLVFICLTNILVLLVMITRLVNRLLGKGLYFYTLKQLNLSEVFCFVVLSHSVQQKQQQQQQQTLFYPRAYKNYLQFSNRQIIGILAA